MTHTSYLDFCFILSSFGRSVQIGRCLHVYLGINCRPMPEALTQHPALPPDMRSLRAKYTDEVDLEWIRRFQLRP